LANCAPQIKLTTAKQAGTANDPISAIQAAINTKTTLLLGIWASGGQGLVDSEITALKRAIQQYGTAFTSLVTGLSVGSEDLYRISPTGLAAPDAAPGADPATLTNYIQQVRAAVSGTALSSVKIGHVDTWTAWVNGSNDAVINAVDFIGMDAYPYFQSTMANGIENNDGLFKAAYDATVAAAGGKDIWVTETGFPVSGKQSGAAVPSLANAKTYWDQVGCGRLFGKVNTYWFTLQDAYPITPNPSFGIVGSTLSTTPLYDLSCADVASPSSVAPSSSASAQASSSASSGSSSGSGSGSGSGSSSASVAVPTGVSGGLSPSVGGGNGVVSSVISVTTAAPVASSVATLSVGGSNTTIVTSIVPGNGSGSSSTPKPSGTSTSTGQATLPSSGAGVRSRGSIVGAIGAMVALVVAL
jgi:glucan endo-1,3-beta-D-glucosidase